MSHTSQNYDISGISGNAQPDIKNTVVWALDPKTYFNDGIRFAQSVGHRLSITEVSVNQKLDEPQKLEARVIVGTTVEEGACLRRPRVAASN
jgi:acyl-coenzyme A thioesterase 13